MPEPRTWDLIGGCVACLARITHANGFFTDAGAYVTREPHQIPESQGALVAVVLEALGAAADPALTRTHRLATVLMVAKVATDQDDAQIQLHRLIDDVERAFARRQQDFPVGLQFPLFVDAKPLPPEEGMAWVGAEIRFTSHVPKAA